MKFDFSTKGIQIPADAPVSEAGDVITLCPKCSHTRKKSHLPCLSVNTERGVWNCFHCGWKGGFGGHEDFIDLPDDFPDFDLPNPPILFPGAIHYLRGRGITPETALANRVLSTVDDNGNETSKVAYPRFYPNGSVVGIQYRDFSQPKSSAFTQERGGATAFWGYHNVFDGGVSQTDTIYITEGVEDALSLYQAGFFFVLSLPSGANSTKAVDDPAFQLLLKSVTKVVLVLDADEPGKKAQDELARRIGFRRVWRVQFPTEIKDANEMLQKHGEDALRKVVNEASQYPIHGLFTIKNAEAELRQMRVAGLDRGRTTGIDTLDNVFRLRDATLYTLGAVPKAGKSRFINQLAINDARIHGKRWAFFAPESLPIHYHTSKLQSAYIGKPFEELSDKEFKESFDFVQEYFSWMVPDDFDTDSLLSLANDALATKGVSVFVFDPFNYISIAGENQHEGIGKTLAKQVDFTRKTNSIVLNIAHPTKLETIKEGRGANTNENAGEYPLVTAYDMSGSAHFANRSDVFLSLWRSILHPYPIQLHCGLSKFEEVATMGSYALLRYDSPTSRFQGYHGSKKDKLPVEFDNHGKSFDL